MPRYSIIKMRDDMYYVFSEGEILFKTFSEKAAIAKVHQLEYFDLLKESMTPY